MRPSEETLRAHEALLQEGIDVWAVEHGLVVAPQVRYMRPKPLTASEQAALDDAAELMSVYATGRRFSEKERAERDRPDWFAAEERAGR